MNKIDPKLKELAITLKNVLRESETREIQTRKIQTRKIQTRKNTVLNLWPSYTLKEILENPLFYELPITQPTLMTSHQFFNSLKSKNVPQEIINNLSLININYRGFDNEIHCGQIIIHKDLAPSISKIFKRIITETNFPMTSVFPISMFDWNSSLKLNNSGAFDWRFVSNSNEISDHSFGAAIDINPILNPWVREGSVNSPNFSYDQNKKGTLHANSDVVKIFKEEGWKWGGDWKNSKDWMHFYRPEIPFKYYGKVEVEE